MAPCGEVQSSGKNRSVTPIPTDGGRDRFRGIATGWTDQNREAWSRGDEVDGGMGHPSLAVCETEDQQIAGMDWSESRRGCGQAPMQPQQPDTELASALLRPLAGQLAQLRLIRTQQYPRLGRT